MKTLYSFITESRIIKNKKFISMLEKAGFYKVTLEDDKGTVYIYDEIGDVSLYDHAWYGVYFREQNPEHWVLDIAIKYLENADADEIKKSENIHPNFEYLYQLCDEIGTDSKYFRKELDKYSKNFQ